MNTIGSTWKYQRGDDDRVRFKSSKVRSKSSKRNLSLFGSVIARFCEICCFAQWFCPASCNITYLPTWRNIWTKMLVTKSGIALVPQKTLNQEKNTNWLWGRSRPDLNTRKVTLDPKHQFFWVFKMSVDSGTSPRLSWWHHVRQSKFIQLLQPVGGGIGWWSATKVCDYSWFFLKHHRKWVE